MPYYGGQMGGLGMMGGYGGQIPMEGRPYDYTAGLQQQTALAQSNQNLASSAKNQITLNSLRQQAVQQGQMTLDNAVLAQQKENDFANMLSQHTSTTVDPAQAAQQAPQVGGAQGAQAAQQTSPVSAGQGPKPTLGATPGTDLADHTGVTGFLANPSYQNKADTSVATTANPTFAAQHIFDSTNPDGSVTHNTFDRQGLLDSMNDYTDRNGNHTMAADANKLGSQFVLSDAADEKAKHDKLMDQNAQILGLTGALPYMSDQTQASAYNKLKSQAQQIGGPQATKGWPTDPTDPNFKSWIEAQGEEARQNIQTHAIASKRAEDQMTQVKNNNSDTMEAFKGNLQAQLVASEVAKNNAEANKLPPSNGIVPSGLENVPKNLQAPAAAAAQKVNDKFTGATQALDNLDGFIADAKSGNRVAGNMVGTQGVLTTNGVAGIHRFNPAEVQQISGAGNILDQMANRYGKITEGQPMNMDRLNDLQAMSRTLRAGVVKEHQSALANVDTAHGSNFAGAATTTPKSYTVRTAADYSAIPPGATYTDPNGNVRTKK